MKPCPYCAEEIQEAAVKCRFCKSDLTTSEPVRPPTAMRTQGYRQPKMLSPKIINPDERIIIEEHPDPNFYFVGPVTFILISLLFPAMLLISVPVLLMSIVGWSNCIYAATDKRIITISGILNKKRVECKLPKIQNSSVNVKWGYFGTGDISFDTAGGPFKELVWVNIKKARDVYNKVSQLI